MPTIVLADDHPDLLIILAGRFRSLGYVVHQARNGAEALELARRVAPDILVLDVMMPELNGFQVCRRLKEAAETADLPVVLLTAKTSAADRFWGGEVGADRYLTKPVDPAEVAQVVAGLLAAKQPGAAPDG